MAFLSGLKDYTDPDSLGSKMRARRWDIFVSTFPGLADMRVLDLGGVPNFWRAASLHPAHVTTVNLRADLTADEPWIETVVGDACTWTTRGYDLVLSNSLIEHVGGHASRQKLAAVIRDAAPRYWVQTPYRYFPIEPHFIFPGMQFLPIAARARLARRWLAGPRHVEADEALSRVQWIELLGVQEMRHYFPDAELRFERLYGLPKSLIAVR